MNTVEDFNKRIAVTFGWDVLIGTLASFLTFVLCDLFLLKVSERIFGPFWAPGERRDYLKGAEIGSVLMTHAAVVFVLSIIGSSSLHKVKNLSFNRLWITPFVAISSVGIALLIFNFRIAEILKDSYVGGTWPALSIYMFLAIFLAMTLSKWLARHNR